LNFYYLYINPVIGRLVISCNNSFQLLFVGSLGFYIGSSIGNQVKGGSIQGTSEGSCFLSEWLWDIHVVCEENLQFPVPYEERVHWGVLKRLPSRAWHILLCQWSHVRGGVGVQQKARHGECRPQTSSTNWESVQILCSAYVAQVTYCDHRNLKIFLACYPLTRYLQVIQFLVCVCAGWFLL
jgi:hypothetical protein